MYIYLFLNTLEAISQNHDNHITKTYDMTSLTRTMWYYQGKMNACPALALWRQRIQCGGRFAWPDFLMVKGYNDKESSPFKININHLQ